MKKIFVGIVILFWILHTEKLTVSANAGFSSFLSSIEIQPIQCVEVSIPEYSGFKSFMSFKTFGKKTAQYELQQLATTDANGLRKINDYYIIAVGSYFEAQVGQRIDLVLENGEVIKCLVGDEKADKDTDSANIFSRNNGCMSEFIVDTCLLEKTVKKHGDVSFLPDEEWNSPVTKIILYDEIEEDLWQSQD